MMSENNMTVIALESDSDSAPDPQSISCPDGQLPAQLPASSGSTAGGRSAGPGSNPDWMMQHWSEALRQSSRADIMTDFSGSSASANPSSNSGGLSGGLAANKATIDALNFNAESPAGTGDTASDEEEKLRLVAQIAELQSTLEDLSHRVETVKEENLKLSSENRILGQYIENLMAASSVFAAATASDAGSKARRRSSRRHNKPQ